MFSCDSLRCVSPRVGPLLWAFALLSGCSAEPEPLASAAALRLRFPDQSAAVLEAREAFLADRGGFHLDADGARGRPSRPHVVLPREGSEPIRFRTPAGVEVRVREHGASGEGTPVGQAVAYRRTGGTSFWAATDHGVEEWLLLDEGVARGGEAVAAWHVEGATLRARGEVVEVVEPATGSAVLRVSAPRAYASSGRPVAMALRARGSRIELSVDAGGEAVLVDPAWVLMTGEMQVPRIQHAATLLESGLVLVAGGTTELGTDDAPTPLRSAELYDPTTDTWTLTGEMLHARNRPTATRLPNGMVLVVAAYDDDDGPVRAELYDPETRTWTATGEMWTARIDHTATLVNGLVLVAGGSVEGKTPEVAELYDPETNEWTPTGAMGYLRFGASATLLQNGKVLVAGGEHIVTTSKSAELYDVETDTWTPTGEMKEERFGHEAVLLPNGKVLVTGGGASPELYDPETDTWDYAPPMQRPRGEHTMTLLPRGLVLAAGGRGDGVSHRSPELYDPDSGSWELTSPMKHARIFHTATLLQNGEVLVAGGVDGESLIAETERFGMALGEPCAPSSACQYGALCIDGVCCEAPCPCGTCSAPGDEGRCSEAGDPAKAGTICAPTRCADETHSAGPARCALSSSACPAQVAIDCIAYRCDPESGACKQSCASLDDCAPGFVCNLRGHCVPPPPAPGDAAPADAAPGSAAPGGAAPRDDDGGCSAASGPSPAPAAARGLGALLVALCAARRRRRPGAGARHRVPQR
ncbi:kelch repeat-containing protein [Sorangium sp. So ce1036]|uniref:Kelch repeat-containing protein n=1 Tax=Sorangium sp. So ce1036 TaxID=3133328 RepID=UPI003F0122BC